MSLTKIYEQNIGTPSNGFTLKLEVTHSENIETNKTIIESVKGYVKRNNSSYYPYNTTSDCVFTVYGFDEQNVQTQLYTNTTHPTYNLGSNGYKQVLNLTPNLEIEHLDDGAKKIGLYFKFDGKLSNYYPNGSILEEYILPTIARASKVTATNADIGTDTQIIINRLNTDFTTTLEYKANGETEYTTLLTKSTLPSYSWSIPTSFYNLCTDAKFVEVELKAITYNGDTVIGTTTTTFKALVNEEENKPAVTASLVDTVQKCINLTGSNTRLIKGISRAKITWSTTPKNGATIVSKKLNGIEVTSPYTMQAWADEYKLEVTDSRGFVTNIVFNNEVVDYKLPKISATGDREAQTSSNVLVDIVGTYYNGAFNSTGSNSNNITVTFKYRQTGTEEWTLVSTAITVNKANGTFSANDISLGELFDYQSEWEIQMIVTDTLGEIGEYGVLIGKGISACDIYEDNDGVNHFNINGQYDVNDETLVVDNLTTEATNRALSAKQGKILNTLLKNYEMVDYTDKCTFKNCTFNSGRVVKIGNIVIIQVSITPTVTTGWGDVVSVPKELYPLIMSEQHKGTKLLGVDAWVYTTGAPQGAGNIRLPITNGTELSLVGMWLVGGNNG